MNLEYLKNCFDSLGLNGIRYLLVPNLKLMPTLILDFPSVNNQELEEYVKKNGNPVKHIAFNYVKDILISTIFLSVNCQWRQGYPPLFFETEVFGGRTRQVSNKILDL